MRTLILMASLVWLLAACTPQKILHLDERQQIDVDECKASASSINDPPYNSNNQLWASYFEMCMTQRGFTAEELRGIWY